MKRIAAGALILVACLSVSAVGLGQDKAATPAEQFQALLKQYQLASSSGQTLSDDERMKFVGQVYKLRNQLAEKFVELAQQHPTDPIALDALMQAVWQVNGTPWPVELVGQDNVQAKALAILSRDHIRSERLGSVCQRVSFGFRQEYEIFLRAVLEKTPHQDVQALACLGLAHFLTSRGQRVEMAREQPQLAQEFAGLFGKDYLQELLRQDRGKIAQEAEALFERAADKYGDVTSPGGGTVGKKAKSELFEIRHLSVGKVAPDIAGEDQDGQRFKLSDYRGKVVLLDFWSEY